MYRALGARWNKRKRVRQREKDAVRGRDACYETTAWEPGEERRGAERRVKPVGRALRERAFIFYLASLSPFSPSITLCSLSPPLFLFRSAFLLFSLYSSSSFTFSFFILLPLASFPLVSPHVYFFSSLCSFRLFSLLPPLLNPFDLPLSSRCLPRAKIKRRAAGGRE